MVRARPSQSPPEARGRLEARLGLVGVGGCRQVLIPRQRAVDPFALLEDVSGADPTALDAQRHVGSQPDRLTRPRGVGNVAIAALQRPRRRCASVVERGLAHQFHLDLTVDALGDPHQSVVGVIVGGR
ncbi:MAG TPA: hypothetical protein VE575_02405, partial [Acidimicrobiales bacterium]|nr:hypothetical protein [Acidimicrobiales bacterium]